MRTFSVFVFFLLVQLGYAQKNIGLQEVLNEYQTREGVYFSYDASLVNLIDIDFPYEGLTLEEFVKQLNSRYLLSVTPIDAKYYALQAVQATVRVQIEEKDNAEEIPPEDVRVFINGEPIETSFGDGHLTFDYKPIVGDKIVVQGLGFDPVEVTTSQLVVRSPVRVKMSRQTIELGGLTISDYLTRGIDLNPNQQSIRVAVKDLPLLPGETDGDLFASLAALPGVATPDNRPGNLYIRGSSTDQSLVMYDNIPIYHRGHYYGMISPYNPHMIAEVNVYRSGTHPRLGGRVGGAVEIASEDTPIDQHSVGLGSNLLYALGYAKVPLVKDKVSFGLAARKSYPVQFNSPKLSAMSDAVFAASSVTQGGEFPDEFLVNFEDYVGKLNYQMNEKNLFNFTTIYARTDVNYVIGELEVPENNGFDNYGASFSWHSNLSKRMDSKLSVMISDYTFQQEVIGAQGTPQEGETSALALNNIIDIGADQEFSFELNTLSLQTGVEVKKQRVAHEYLNRLSSDPSQIVVRDESSTADYLSPYVNCALNGFERFYLQLGLRGTYYSLLDDFRLEPRLFANIDVSDDFMLKGSAGLYNQYLSQVKELTFINGGFDNELWQLAEEDANAIIKGSQYMFGGIYTYQDWVFDVEGYYKTADGVTYYSNAFLTDADYYFTGSHTMYGIDLFVKHQVGEYASLWGGYSSGQIKIALDTARDVTYDGKYSIPHELYLGGGFDRGNLKLSAGWKYRSGLIAKSLDIIAAENSIINSEGRLPPSTARMFGSIPHRYPVVHTLDVSASYRIPKSPTRPVAFTFGLSVINLYDRENLTDRVLRGGSDSGLELIDRDAIRFAPNIMFLAEF